MEDLFIIIGLGNPGKRYESTRHNVGFETVEYLSAKHKVRIAKIKHKALIGDGVIKGKRALLVKPQTFMNASGESVREIAEWYGIPRRNLILVHDDVDLPLGRLRVRARGSAGTHNGMRSVIYHLQDDFFPRVKIGIGEAPENWELADYVLGRFGPEERKLIDGCIIEAAEAVEAILADGVEAAMNTFNGK